MHPSSQCDRVPRRRIRVLVIDDHAAVRHTIATFVIALDDLELAGEAASGEEALRQCAQSCPDVVLIAISTPGISAVETTRTIVGRWPCTRVVGMCTFQEEEQVPQLLRAGAVAYLLKNVSAEELARTIRRAHAV